jgi:hypothetical protein
MAPDSAMRKSRAEQDWDASHFSAEQVLRRVNAALDERLIRPSNAQRFV